jgi:signal transduction histidine kinase
MRLGLRGRILLLVLVALAPPTVIAVIVALEERNEAREHAQRDVLQTAEVAAADVQRVFTGTAGFMAPLSRDLAGRPGRSSCERLLGLVPRSTTRYSSVGLALEDGAVFCGATRRGIVPDRKRASVAGEPWFREAAATDRVVLGDVGRDPLSGSEAIVVARRIAAPPGSPRRVLFAAVAARGLADATALSDAPPGATFVLFDRRGTIIARVPRLQGAVGDHIDEQWLAEEVLRRRRGTAEVAGVDGVSRIQGFTPVGGPAGEKLFVAGGRATAEVFADPTDDLRRFLLLAALGTVLALALSFLATKLLLQRWTSAVVDSARRFGAGDLTARAPVPHGLGELTDVANALNSAAEDIERRQAEQAALLAEVVAAEEETRRRIAADIHDDTAQAVAAAGLRIDALIGELEDAEAREAGANARQALAEANKRLRRLLFELRPPALDEAGLAAALEQYMTEGFAHDGCDWRVDNRLDAEPSPEVRAILYRVALEALTNVRKHSGASLVEVQLERRGLGVAVQVRDDGSGFDLPAPDAPAEPGHIGLISMRERAEAAGGRFALTSMPGGGTTVDFWMPEPNGRPGSGNGRPTPGFPGA